MKFIRECQQCKTKFEVPDLSSWAKRKFCDDCKIIRNREANKKYKPKYYAKNKHKWPEYRRKSKEKAKLKVK